MILSLNLSKNMIFQHIFDSLLSIIFSQFFLVSSYLIMNKQIILEMTQNYPFGELGQTMTSQTNVVVQKTLHTSSQVQQNLIRQMVAFIKAIPHPNLITLNYTLQGDHQIHLYYQYVPFKVEKWLLTVNEDLLNKIEEQLTDLTQFLFKSSVKFSFNPGNVGVDADMNVKYFLSDFSVDFDDQEQSRKEILEQIKAFIEELRIVSGQVGSQEQVKSARLGSLSTNESISPLEGFISLAKSLPTNCQGVQLKKSSGLSAKVQSSMQKSLQVLARLKKKNQK